MAILHVGPFSTYPSIAAAMLDAAPADTILLEDGYSNETADVTQSGMTFTGAAASVGITLRLSAGVTAVALTGLAPINVEDASGGNAIVGNGGNNRITVTGGADAVDGGLGIDRLIVDYALATGNVTGDSTSNFTEAGGGARMVTITDGTIEHFTILTGSGADTITTGAGNDIVRTGNGASTVTVGQGANVVDGGDDADTITALDGGNRIDAGNGSNTVTTGGGNDTITTGSDTDTIVSGGGADRITLRGGPDTVNAGADFDRLIVDYAALTTNVTGGVTSGNLGAGYTGLIASTVGDFVDFVEAEAFDITTGSGDDSITTGDAADRLFGGAGIDTLSAGGGADLLNGGAGDDVMAGGLGNDIYIVDSAGDVIQGEVGTAQGGGIDTVRSFIDYTAPGNIELVRLGNLLDITNLNGTGNDAPGTLVGNAGANTLNGRGGNDQVNGNDGNDTIIGGEGRDTLVGGAGADTFVFNAVSSSRAGATNRDFINGFARTPGDQDIIDLQAIDANTLTSGINDAFSFIGTAAFAFGGASAGQLRVQGVGGPNALILEADVNGDRVADMQIFVNLQTTMTAGDFLL